MANKELILNLLNSNPKNKRTYTEKDLIGTYGTFVTKINGSNELTLSEVAEKWNITAECPNCKHKNIVNAANVNTLFTCKCGKKLAVCVPDKLL